MVGEPYRVDRRRTSHEAYGGALQAGVQTKTVYQHLVYAGRDKARGGDEQQMRRRLHILILAQGADSLLAQFYALRFEPLDRKSTRLNYLTNAHLVCLLLLDKKK